jgi:hypothetical protein
LRRYERGTENPPVGGSIPSLGIFSFNKLEEFTIEGKILQ